MQSVCVIIENDLGKFLLLLRDDIPSIPYPNKWDILGGVVKKDESPKNAIIREIKEEIEFDLKDFKLIKKYEREEKTEYIYYSKINIDTKTNPLHEGQKIQYFSKEEIETMDLGFHDNEIMQDFFSSQQDGEI